MESLQRPTRGIRATAATNPGEAAEAPSEPSAETAPASASAKYLHAGAVHAHVPGRAVHRAPTAPAWPAVRDQPIKLLPIAPKVHDVLPAKAVGRYVVGRINVVPAPRIGQVIARLQGEHGSAGYSHRPRQRDTIISVSRCCQSRQGSDKGRKAVQRPETGAVSVQGKYGASTRNAPKKRGPI